MAITVHLPTLPELELPQLRRLLSSACDLHHPRGAGADRKAELDRGRGRPGAAVRYGRGWFRGRRTRLAHQADGGCVFLDEKGLCRIHAKFGEPAKPLACRVYPYAFHPSGKSVVVSLRYSCPSVVANRGATLKAQEKDLKELARLVVPEGETRCGLPPCRRAAHLEWPDFRRLVAGLDKTFADRSVPLVARIVQAVEWVTHIGQANFEKIRGDRVDELVDVLRQAVAEQMPAARSDLGAIVPGTGEFSIALARSTPGRTRSSISDPGGAAGGGCCGRRWPLPGGPERFRRCSRSSGRFRSRSSKARLVRFRPRRTNS